MNVVRTIKNVLLEFSKDPRMSGMLHDLTDNNDYQKQLQFEFSEEAKKLAYSDYASLVTCYPHLCVQDEIVVEEKCNEVYLLPMTCADIAGAGGHCVMLPMAGINGEIIDCGDGARIAAINAVMATNPEAAMDNGCGDSAAFRPQGAAGAASAPYIKSICARVNSDMQQEQAIIQATLAVITNTLMNYAQTRTKLIQCPVCIYQKPDAVMMWVDGTKPMIMTGAADVAQGKKVRTFGAPAKVDSKVGT